MNEERNVTANIGNTATNGNQYHINDQNARYTAEEDSGRLVIKVETPADFDQTMETQITTSDEVSRIINNLMVQVFADYHGCSIVSTLIPGVGMVCTPRFFFKIFPDEAYDDPNAIFAFNPVGRAKSNGTGNSLYNRIQHVSNTVATPMSRKMEMTKDAKSALSDLMINGAHGKKFEQWDTAYNLVPTAKDTFIALSKLDITKILRKIFGEVDAENTPLYYAINPVYNLGGYGTANSKENWLLTIHRIHHGAEARAASLAGITIPDDYGVPPMVVAVR